jgi:hypothetical protein
MSRATEERNRHMLRAHDAMDRDYAKPLDISAVTSTRTIELTTPLTGFSLPNPLPI